MSKKPKKEKKKKLDSIAKINRKLFKLWSLAVRDRAGNKCEFCGIKNKEININGKPTKIDAHHLLSRDVLDCPLKFEILNGIAVCPICHKWGMPSFHRDAITTITWLIKNRPERYEHVLKYKEVRVDLQNRAVLAEIEKRLIAKESLDLNKLKEIEKQFPRESKSETTFSGSIFDSDKSSSSSSSG